MIQRLFVSLGLAMTGMFATTGTSLAFDPSRDEMVGGTFLVVLAAMGFLLCIYGLKRLFGIDQHRNDGDLPDPGHH